MTSENADRPGADRIPKLRGRDADGSIMAWYLRTIRGGTDGVSYETLDLVLEQVRHLKERERRQGHRVVTDIGRVSFYDGADLIDTVRIEDEEGQDVPIPDE